MKPAGAGGLATAERALRARIDGFSPEHANGVLSARLQAAPDDAAALLLLAELAFGFGRLVQAGSLLERALSVAPGYAAARFLYARVLFRRENKEAAVAQCRRLLTDDPGNLNYRTLLASSLTGTGDFDEAVGVYGSILRRAPLQPEIWLDQGQVLKLAGRGDEARRALRRCVQLAPANGHAWWELENLSSAPCSAADLASMRGHLARPDLPVKDRFLFNYALGYALEKAGDHAGSFAHYSAGAAVWRGSIRYSADAATARARRAAAFFTANCFSERAGWGEADSAPIFIVGLPRAGSTLIEQILGSHSLVEGTQELPEIGKIVRDVVTVQGEAGMATYPACLGGLSAADLAGLGQRYLRETRVYRKTGRPYFVDKMPGNWAEIGLIQLILPRAKIIDARRHPMANCFGAFKKYFPAGQNFTYDFDDLGRYYKDYLQLMGHFDTVLPGRVHRVQYEALVADTEAEVRRLLAYCGLPFEAGCLRFWESGRAVSTASAEQVRRPIYREGLEHWRHYEPWLGPLKEALG